MQIYDLKQQLIQLNNKLDIIKNKLGSLDKEIQFLEQQQQKPENWNDTKFVAETSKQLKVLKAKQNSRDVLISKLQDLKVAIELEEEITGSIPEQEIEELLKDINQNLDSLWIETLLNGEYDAGPAVIMVHSGAGGEEAQDWADMLVRMFIRYCMQKEYKITLLESTPGDGAGIKSQTYLIDGDFAYGYLKAEKGVHRLVRLSPFDANNRRHTSFASLEVLPFIDDSENQVKINSEDIIIDTFRSSGAGGQHVNKTESAIRITHKPTGIVVTCQNERSQIRNKEMALKLLASKLTEKELAEKERQKLEKISSNKKIEWGSQIKSYVMHPYSLVKDHRTGYETGNVLEVLNGGLQPFINEYLKVTNNEQ